ncbi:hypothetical protein AAC387_Pa10g0284 [Persea americana]
MNDKKKSHAQRKITQQWAAKEDDHDTAMVCMIRARRGRRSARLMAQSSNPIESEELDNAFKGHETPVTDEDTPLINKNTEGMDSLVLRAIDDNVSLTTQSLESSPSPHTGPRNYPVFMARETSAPVNVEEQAEGENPVDNL